MSIEKLNNGDFVMPQLFEKFNNLVDTVSGLTQNSGTTISGDYLPLSSFTSYSANTLNDINSRLIGFYLTTEERLILGDSLNDDSEIFVLDTDLKIFFAWVINDWIPIGSITQENPNLVLPPIPNTPSNYPIFNLSATTENNTTPIIYQSSNLNIATVDSSGNVTVDSSGNVTITVSQASGNGYEGSQVSRSFNVVEPLFQNITTDNTFSATTLLKTISNRNNYLSIYIPEHSTSSEKHGLIRPRFNISLKINSTTHIIEVDFLSKYVIKVSEGDEIYIGSDVARDLVISEGWSNNIENNTLRNVTGTNILQNTDTASVGTINMPLFNNPSKHITLPPKERLIRFNSNGNEKYQVLYKEFDGLNWSPTQKITVPKIGNITLETTQREICFATTSGGTININVPTITVINRNTNIERRFSIPSSSSSTQYQVSNVTQLMSACSNAVAGDEILLLYAGSPYTGVTINTSAFTANIMSGRKGAEGIIIRGQIVGSNKPIIKPTPLIGETNGAIAINNGDATLFTYVKDLQLDSTGGGCFQWVSGKWMTINVDGGGVDTRAVDGDIMISAVGNTAKLLESYYFDCDLADAYADIFNFNGNIASAPNTAITASSKVELHNCSSQRAGGFANSQCMTTHAQLDIFSIGCLYSDAFLDVVAHETTNDSISWHLFDKITMGTRKCGAYGNYYDSIIDATANMGHNKGNNPYHINNTIYWRIGSPSYGSFRSAICVQECNIMIREAGTSQMVFSSGSSSRVISKKSLFHGATSNAALQVSNFAGSSNNNLDAIGNTFFGCTKAMSAFDSFNTLRFGNNACIQNGASVADVPVSPNNRCVSLGNNVCDPTFDTDTQITGSDITNADAQVDTTYFRPTTSGNCDNGQGLFTLYNAIGGRDPYGIIHIQSSSLTPRGAFARLITSGLIVPELYN